MMTEKNRNHIISNYNKQVKKEYKNLCHNVLCKKKKNEILPYE